MTDAAEPYLIAHLVRGQPAFDIAIRCDDMGTASDPGPWWIVPTSGHRAYPFEAIPLEDLEHWPTGWSLDKHMQWSIEVKLNQGHPDHYSPTAASRGQGLITNLAERLGLVKKPAVSRR